MALAFYFAPQANFSAQQYDECIKLLRKAGANHPAGRMYHASFGTSDRVSIFDVWTSQAAFEKFGQTLLPILHALGVDPGQPQVMAVHNVIVPPAASRPAGRKRAPAKKAASKKGAASRKTRAKSRTGKKKR